MIKTAVVILNYNGEKLLRQFLPSAIEHTHGAELIVADNGSTDQSISILEKEFPSVRIILLEKNFGFCGGYNRALAQVDADAYVLLNSDVEVTANWLLPMLRLLETDSTVAAIQPKILSYQDKTKFEYAGAAGGFIDALGYPFCRGRIFNHIETDDGQYNDQRDIFWASGACLMIRANIYKKFGGLDEDLFAHMEEIDLCWKIHRSSDKVCYCGSSTVYHLGAGTLGYKQPRKTYYNFRNGLTLIFKHLDTWELFLKLPVRFMLDWVAAFIFLAKGQPGNMIAVLRAHYRFLRHLNKNLRKRRLLRSEYPHYSRKTIRPGLVIVDYYFKQKKTFVQ
ncbi:MAG: glycosyltransferase family 2 protein [Cyclobacteriaceae bacterium]|nr:glycosyltransferase family 2 protein [Cyclobacteriaceae bacterium]